MRTCAASFRVKSGAVLAQASEIERRIVERPPQIGERQMNTRAVRGAGRAHRSTVTAGSGRPLHVNRYVLPVRTLATSAGRKQATHVPPFCLTLG